MYNQERYDQEGGSQINGWFNTHPPAHSAAVNQLFWSPHQNGGDSTRLTDLLEQMLQKTG